MSSSLLSIRRRWALVFELEMNLAVGQMFRKAAGGLDRQAEYWRRNQWQSFVAAG
jgi:hypothetical protein